MDSIKEINGIIGSKIEGNVYNVLDNKIYVKNYYGNCGVINTDGNVIIPFEYSIIFSFKDGFCVCIRDSKCYIYDSYKNDFIKTDYEYLNYIGNGYFRTSVYSKNDSLNVDIIDSKGNHITSLPTFKTISFNKNNIILRGDKNKYPLYDKEFNPISKEYEEISDFHNGVAIFKIRCYPEFSLPYPLFGLIDEKGVERVRGKFLSVSFIDDDKYMVVTKRENVRIINSSGKVIRKLNIQSEKIGMFYNNKAIAHCGYGDGVVDCNGNIIIELKYYNIKRVNDYFLVEKSHSLFGLYDDCGNIILECIYSSIDVVAKDLFIVCKDNKTCIVKSNGECIYESKNQICYKAPYFFVKEKDKILVINKNGEMIFSKQASSVDFKNNYFVFCNDNKFELCDVLGNTLINHCENEIYILDNNKIIANNYLIDMNQEYLNKTYELKIEYDGVIIFKNFKDKNSRDKYKEYLEQTLLEELNMIRKNKENDINSINDRYQKKIRLKISGL